VRVLHVLCVRPQWNAVRPQISARTRRGARALSSSEQVSKAWRRETLLITRYFPYARDFNFSTTKKKAGNDIQNARWRLRPPPPPPPPPPRSFLPHTHTHTLGCEYLRFMGLFVLQSLCKIFIPPKISFFPSFCFLFLNYYYMRASLERMGIKVLGVVCVWGGGINAECISLPYRDRLQ